MSSPLPQAEPLPCKRGEIGFRESIHADLLQVPSQNVQPLPAGHPPGTVIAPSPPVATTVVDHTPAPLVALFKKPRQFYNSGIRVSTILLLTSQSAVLLMTITLWVIVIKVVPLPSTPALFIHMPFAIGITLQLFLLERTAFKARAERYAKLHPGEAMPPTFLHSGRRASRLPIAPWNRPPLPNYAAVLQELNVGTGDVEDNRIAIPPPPAYGITRGSTLLLAGSISEDLRDESHRIQVEQGERSNQMRLSQASQDNVSRPMSYMSQISGSEYEARCDLIRARALEVTLGRLNQQGS